MKSLAAALVLVLAAGTAHAQPGNVEPVDPDEPPPRTAYLTQPQPLPLQPERSESTALWLSLGGTLGSYALIFGGSAIAAQSRNDATSRLAGSAASVGLVGTLLAPSFGHWYGGKGFTRGFGLRLGGIGVGIVAIAVALSGCTLFYGGHDDGADEACGRGEPAGAVLGIAALGMWIGGTVDDIVQAPRRVRRRNAAQFVVTPLLQRDSAGLALAGAF